MFELAILAVVRHETLGSLVTAQVHHPDLGVDVEQYRGVVLVARRPDAGIDTHILVPEVILIPGAVKVELGGSLLGITREVVSGLVSSFHTCVQLNVATEIGRKDRKVPSLGNVEADVELTVLAVLLDTDVGTQGSEVLVEDQGEDLTTLGDALTDTALRTAGTGVLELFDVDFLGVGAGTDWFTNDDIGEVTVKGTVLGNGGDNGGKEEGSDGKELHDFKLKVCVEDLETRE